MQILLARMDLPARPAAPQPAEKQQQRKRKADRGGADLPPLTALVKLTPPRLAKPNVRRKNLRGSKNHQETEMNQDTLKIDTTTMRTVTIATNAERIVVVREIVEGRVRGTGV